VVFTLVIQAVQASNLELRVTAVKALAVVAWLLGHVLGVRVEIRRSVEQQDALEDVREGEVVQEVEDAVEDVEEAVEEVD